ARDIPFLGAGAWSTALLVLYLAFVQMIRQYDKHQAWVPEEEAGRDQDDTAKRKQDAPETPTHREKPLNRLILSTTIMALGTVVTGILLSRTGDAIAKQTGLGSGFAGLVLGGIATSLPEVSTTFAAVRVRQFELAFSDAYG